MNILTYLFSPYINEFQNAINLFGTSFSFHFFIIVSLITTIVTLCFTYLTKYNKKIQSVFIKHEYTNEPKNLAQQIILAKKAPLNSANGICMWRLWGSLPLVLLSAVFFKLSQPVMIGVIQLYIFLFITDALDGIIARALGNVTHLGESLDPLTDKVLDLPILLVVCAYSYSPTAIFIAIFIMGFDILGTILRGKSKNPAASWVGKSKTIIKVITIIFYSLSIFDLYFKFTGMTLLIITLILAYWSFYGKLSPKMRSRSLRFLKMYLYLNFKFVRNIFKKPAIKS